MKKSNLLIAVFAVLAAASVAKAEEIKVDFDGKKGFSPQSMHDIFAAAKGDSSVSDIDPESVPIPWTSPVPGDLPLCDGINMFPWANLCRENPSIPENCRQAEGGGWWWVAVCDDSVPVFPSPDPWGFETFSRMAPGSKGAAKNNISNFFLDYANTHDDFAASVLPALASKQAKVFFDKKGGAYAVNGRTVVRLDFARLGMLSAAGSRQNKIAPAIEAALIVAETVQTWYDVYNTWNEYHSSDNDSGSHGGSMSPQDAYDIQHNIQRDRVR